MKPCIPLSQVFLNEKKCRALAWQFSEIQPPSAVLFRDQMVRAVCMQAPSANGRVAAMQERAGASALLQIST
eukprot:scaffold269565_cov23-Tisochrysis_lutea.AAC.1